MYVCLSHTGYPLDYETVLSGNLWSNTVFLKFKNFKDSNMCVVYFTFFTLNVKKMHTVDKQSFGVCN